MSQARAHVLGTNPLASRHSCRAMNVNVDYLGFTMVLAVNSGVRSKRYKISVSPSACPA